MNHHAAIETSHRSRTLALAAVLHAFTHIYQMALIPLYLPLQKFFGRAEVDDATLLVTAMLVAYFLPSYTMGVLADRFSRKKLLTCGLTVNALGFVGLALAPNYARVSVNTRSGMRAAKRRAIKPPILAAIR